VNGRSVIKVTMPWTRSPDDGVRLLEERFGEGSVLRFSFPIRHSTTAGYPCQTEGHLHARVMSEDTDADPAAPLDGIKTNEFEGLTRIYSNMGELLTAAFPMALAATLLGPKAWRRGAIVLTVLTGLANALTLTRAIYISEIVALFLISLIWARGSGWRPRRIRYLFAFGVVAIVLAIVLAGGGSSTSGNSSSPVQAVISRAELGLSNAQNGTGTVAVRIHEADLDLEVLGDH
jgi:hypothetical protein